MIATRRGLAVLAAIAGALLVVLVVDLARREAPVERTLIPGFAEAGVTRLQWTAHPVGPYLTLERTANGPWRRTAPVPGAVEQAPVRSLLATLRGARWHRVKARDPRVDSAAHLAVDRAFGRLELWIGRPIEGADQAWIGIGDHSYLVDAWVTRALVPSPIELAVRAPLADIASVPAYTVDGVRVEGAPRRSPLATATPLVLDPAYVAELERSLAELTIEELPGSSAAADVGISIEMAGMRVALGGACESRVYLAASTGDGCVTRDAADAVRALVARLHGPVAAIVARAPIPVGVDAVTLVDGTTLDVRKRPVIDGADASTEEVLALMTVLRSPVDVADIVPAPTTPPSGTVSVAIGGGTIALALHPGDLVARTGESVALRLSPEAFAILGRGAAAYRDRTPWREEPTTIDEITVDAVTYQRGAVLGEWNRTPAGPSDAASIDALVRALAAPRVLGVGQPTIVNGRHVRLVVRPPLGGETSHTLVIGAATAAGCPAKIGTEAVLLPVEICRLVPR